MFNRFSAWRSNVTHQLEFESHPRRLKKKLQIKIFLKPIVWSQKNISSKTKFFFNPNHWKDFDRSTSVLKLALMKIKLFFTGDNSFVTKYACNKEIQNSSEENPVAFILFCKIHIIVFHTHSHDDEHRVVIYFIFPSYILLAMIVGFPFYSVCSCVVHIKFSIPQSYIFCMRGCIYVTCSLWINSFWSKH